MTIAFIFPGQGAQAPGMGKSLYDAFASAREVFQEVDEALGEKLSRLIFEGPADELTLTANTQPALMAVSLGAMQAAVPVGEGAMAALIGKVDVAIAEAIVAEGSAAGVVVVANDNNAGNVVISGDKAGVDAALAAAKAKGVRAIPLKVSAPFHSPLMRPAADAMAGALATTEIAPLAVPLVANVTARPINEPTTIRRLLVEQVTGRVRWRESVEWMAGE